MTGITCVSRESIFTDLNNMVVVTTTGGNSLIGKMLCEGSSEIKIDFEDLPHGGSLETQIEEKQYEQALITRGIPAAVSESMSGLRDEVPEGV